MPDLQFPDAKNLQGMAERGFPFPADFDLPPFRSLPPPLDELRPRPGLEPRELLRGLWDLGGWAYLHPCLVQRPVF